MADKMFLKTTFALRSDTLENWQSINPILLMGEPAVVSDSENDEWLKVGDGQTPWQDLPWKKAKAQIIEQNFNPTSENAQSGKAVAQVVTAARDEITPLITDLYTNKADKDERFAVFTTDKPLTDAPYGTSQWVQYMQVKYGCGYGEVKYGPTDYDVRPKIGDMLICTQNGYIYKVAGLNEEAKTIAVWYMAGATNLQDTIEQLSSRITALENQIGEKA